MRNPVGINMKKDEIIVRISEGAEHKEIIECLNKKIPALKKLYKTEKTPIFVTGKVLKNKEINEIKKIIQDNIDVEINFDSPKVLGLHGIKSEEKEDLQISGETIATVMEGMKSVATETGGTAYSVFRDFEIEVGGKTGSAEAGKNVNAWFTGFAPYENPEIAVVAFVENGGHGYYTATVARAIFESYFGTNEEIEEDRTAKSYTGQKN